MYSDKEMFEHRIPEVGPASRVRYEKLKGAFGDGFEGALKLVLVFVGIAVFAFALCLAAAVVVLAFAGEPFATVENIFIALKMAAGWAPYLGCVMLFVALVRKLMSQ